MNKSLAKLSASQEADQALDRMLEKINAGFSGGRVSKHDLTSWIIIKFEKSHFGSCVEAIQKDHFDQVMYLESVVRKMKESRKLGQEQPIQELLAPLGITQKSSRSVKKDQPLEVTHDPSPKD